MKVRAVGKWSRKWKETRHRLICTPRELAKEIMEELRCGSTGIMRYYESHGYEGPSENKSVEDLITRVVQGHVIYAGASGDQEEEE